MDECPNCHAEVTLDATRCPRCALPRDLPVYGEDGAFLGTVFARGSPQPARPLPSGATTGDATPVGVGSAATPGTLFRAPGGEGERERDRRRSRTAGLIAAVLATAAVLGVAVAMVLNIAVFDDQGTETGAAPGEGGSVPPSVPASPPPPPPTTTTPTPTPSRTVEPVDPQAVLAKVGSGVVRVLATGCREGAGMGTGFMINDGQVVTSWPAIAFPATVVVQTADGTPVTGMVSTVSTDHSLALINLDRAITGHQFALADAYGAGDTQANLIMMGLAHTRPTMLDPAIGATATSVSYGDTSIQGVTTLTVPADQVVGGGPAVDAEGAVKGVVLVLPDSDEPVVVGPDRVQDLVDGSGVPMPITDCQQLVGPAGPLQVTEGEHAVLSTYFDGINTGDYSTAYNTFSEQQKKAVKGLDQAAAGWQSTYDFNVRIRSDDGTMVHVTFDSIFKEGAGPEPDMTCARWDLDYRFADGKIDAAKVHGGGAGYSRC